MNWITPEQALQRVRTSEQEGMHLAPAKERPLLMRVLREDAYLFKNGRGGLILPAFDEVQPLLGECEEGDFSIGMPPAMEDWVEGYSNEIRWYQSDHLIDEGDDVAGATEPARKDIAYMCKATWGQGAPYNQNLDFGWGKCKTGCWATAVGIIMQYWGSKGYHRGCMATTPYWYSRHPREFDPLPNKLCFDYRHIVPKPKTEEEKKAVAEMLMYIGLACKLNYGVEGTSVSATLATPLLKERLRMGNLIKYVDCGTKGVDTLDKTLYNELVAGRPVIIRGASADNTGGHFFVADGYRTKDNKYHINWGWTGSYNGWYALSALSPSQGYDYSYHAGATIGIQPDYVLGDVNNDGRVNITDVMVLLEKIQKGDTSIIGDINSDGKIDADDWQVIVDTILGKKYL